jgi:putative endonuclease
MRGRRAEHLAAFWLRLKGYRVLARDYRAGVGEIDLIARRGRVLALVEVKARGGLAEAGEAIGERQQQRIARAARAFLQRHPGLGTLDLRFDAILIAPGRWPRHIRDIWREELRS